MNSSFSQTGIDQARIQSLVQIFTASGTTLSLTTTAGQKVIVWAKGDCEDTAGDTVVNLKYNSVTKDSVAVGPAVTTSNENYPFALQYTETPGAGTQNVTVDGSASLANVVIIALVIG